MREFPRYLSLSGWFGKSILLFAIGLLPLVGFSVDYSLTQESSPAGFFSTTTQTVSANSMVTSLSPILRKDGYRFTHWTISGQRQVDGHGSSRITFSVPLDSDKTAVAHYLPETQDSDADGFPDWLEIRTYGNLDRNGSDDADADGFSLKREQQYGLTPTIKDQIRQGNIARRRFHKISVNFGGALQLTVKSDPPGIVTTDKSLFDINSSHLSPQPPEKRAGYAFGYWTLNGQRVADSTGAAMPRVPFDLNGSMELVAKYFPENQDSDSDGLPDWQEWNAFGNLSQDETSDGDNDGFTTGDEVRYGLNASIKDETRQGNIARRRSKKVFLNLGGAKKLSIGSDPPGFVASSETNPDVNASYLAPNPTRKLSGYAFAYWTRNGTRVADPTGTAIARPNGVMETDVELVAKYLPEKHDSDKDGTPDWQEWNAFGNLDHNASADGDNDGFLLAKELQYGLHPAIPDIIAQGGISRRRSHRVSMPIANLDQNQSTEDRDGDGLNQAQELALGLDPDKADTDGDGFSDGLEYSRGSNPHDPSSLGNYPPSGILLDNNHTYENLPSGTIVGDFNATDPDPGSIHSFSLVQGNGSQHNQLFDIDTNGTLRTAVSFDYEVTESPFSIRVRVSDEFHASLEQNFLITLLNRNESPSGLIATSPLQVFENQPPGTLIGHLSASDPDVYPTLSFSLVPGAMNNDFFTLDTNGTLYSGQSLDYETHSTLSIRARVYDEFNASLTKNFTISVIDSNAPFVRTLKSSGIQQQQFTLRGEVITTLDQPISQYGFHFGNKLLLSNPTILVAHNLTGTNFSAEISLSGLQSDTKYYYRAFARSAEGINFGVVRSLSTPSLPEFAPVWWSAIPEEQGGWRNSSWFGIFLPYSHGWLYHADLNWIYAHPTPTNDFWLWSPKNGWLWTGPNLYPHLFKNSSASWLYFIKKKNGKPLFYDYSQQSIK